MDIIFEGDNWTTSGKKINSSESLETVKRCLENSIIVVEHWHYRRSQAPTRLFFEEYSDYIGYLNSNVSPGDSLHIWSWGHIARDESQIVSGKYPDGKGRVPERGAY